MHISRQSFHVGIIFAFIICPLSILAQDYIKVNSKYTITYTIEKSLNKEKSSITVIKFKKSGNAPNNQLVKWNISIRRNQKKVAFPITIDVPKGNNDIVVPIKLEPDDIIESLQDESSITPINIVLPELEDFKIRLKKSDDFILEGEKVDLFIETKKDFKEIEWHWSGDQKGEKISHIALRDQFITVYGIFKGTSFRTQSQSIKLDVKRANDIIDFSVIVPSLPVDDTSRFTLSLKILKNSLAATPMWVWKDEFGKEINSSVLSQVFTPTPFFKTGNISVCPKYGDRIFGCKKIQVPIHRLDDPPSNFEIIYPNELYTDKEALLYVKQKTRNPSISWYWSINGKLQREKTDSIKIFPQQKFDISVHPYLNKRIGETKKVVLKNVIVRTKLPESIKGVFNFCGVPKKSQSYRLENAELGNDAKSWVLYKNNVEVKRFTSNIIELTPRESAVYHISPDTKPELKTPFNINVIDIPDYKISIDGPTIVCSGRPFNLSIINQKIDTSFRFLWYRRNSENSNMLISSDNEKYIVDSIEKETTYYLAARYNTCEIGRVDFHTVQLYNRPSTPIIEYRYLNSFEDQISLTGMSSLKDLKGWEWSIDDFVTTYQTGNQITKFKLINGFNKFSLRIIDQCNYVSDVRTVSVYKKKYNYFFINAGINSIRFNDFNSYNLTLGSKNWYIRGKTSLPSILKRNYVSKVYGVDLEINDNGRIINYPSSTGTYYITNGDEKIVRNSLTTGFIMGKKRLKIYTGLGYGVADILWGIDTYSYSNGNNISSSFAKNISQSVSGIEAEIGLFIKAKKFNIMTGASVINDPNFKRQYFEFNIGFGFSNK